MRVKSEEKRQAILEIARKEFTEQGFEQTSMAQIARKLGGSKATLYNYFDSKESIFAAVMESGTTQRITTAFVKLSVNKPVRETLIEFGINYLSSILTKELAAIYKMAITESDRSEIGRHFYNNGPAKGWAKIATYLKLAKDAKQIELEDETLAAHQLRSLIEAEVVLPYHLGVIECPPEREIIEIITRAVDSFLKIYPDSV